MRGADRPTLFRPRDRTGLLVVVAVEPPRRLHLHFLDERLEAELLLSATASDRTHVVLTVAGSWLSGLRASLPRTALWRLHSLCQFAATLQSGSD